MQLPQLELSDKVFFAFYLKCKTFNTHRTTPCRLGIISWQKIHIDNDYRSNSYHDIMISGYTRPTETDHEGKWEQGRLGGGAQDELSDFQQWLLGQFLTAMTP